MLNNIKLARFTIPIGIVKGWLLKTSERFLPKYCQLDEDIDIGRGGKIPKGWQDGTNEIILAKN